MWRSKILSHGVRALSGGNGGTPIILLPGWPQTAEAYSNIIPRLTPTNRVLALDPPGLGESTAPEANKYDTASISRILNAAVAGEIGNHTPFHLVGHDIGAWIAYAWAAQFPATIKSLTLLDSAVPGHAAPEQQPRYPLPQEVNIKLWQFSFNALPELPEILTQGRERQLLDWLFDRKAQYPERITEENRDVYVRCYSQPGGMSRGFEYYRAVQESAVQNKEFGKRKLEMPVLALGGDKAVGDNLRKGLIAFAEKVEGGVVEDCGHYVMEEQPEKVASALLDFFSQVDAS